MSPIDELVPILKKLRLSGVLESLDVRVTQAVDGELSHAEFLLRLLTDEVERRAARQLDLRLARAQFEHRKTLEDFNFAFNPELPKSKLLDIASCRFIDTKTNVLLVGPAGVGKSHIAQAVGHRACMNGVKTLYLTANAMFTALRAARGDGSYDKKLAKFTTVDLLIIDDLGLRPLQHDEPHDLYEIIRQRYERRSTIVTSNRAVEEWFPLFHDELLASAAMDRLLHHSHVVKLSGQSYRTAA